MTFLTADIHVADSPEGLAHIQSEIHLVSIDSDFFPHFTAQRTASELSALGKDVTLCILYTRFMDMMLSSWSMSNSMSSCLPTSLILNLYV